MCVSVGNGIYIVVPFVYVIMLQEFTCFHQDKGDLKGWTRHQVSNRRYRDALNDSTDLARRKAMNFCLALLCSPKLHLLLRAELNFRVGN